MSQDGGALTPADTSGVEREMDHERRNHEQGELLRRAIGRLRQMKATAPAVPAPNRRVLPERRRGRGGRRQGDRGKPWWRTGLAFAALCALLRCWRLLRR